MKRLFTIIVVVLMLGYFTSCDEEKQKNNIQQNQTHKVDSRKKIIENQFSSWDGSHKYLTRLVKENMHNPDSFEHVSTYYNDLGDKIRVTMKYRGSNAFGAIVTEQISADFDLYGNFIQLIK